jgi:excisionase family DNA binding protein
MGTPQNQATQAAALFETLAVRDTRAAGLLGISRRSVWRLISRKDLDVVRIGRSVRITTESLTALLRRGGTPHA